MRSAEEWARAERLGIKCARIMVMKLLEKARAAG